MEQMIASLKEYRIKYCGTRKPIFMHEIGSKGTIEDNNENHKGLAKKSKFNVSSMSAN